jgi:AmmeMemoRadiSam system protein B
VQLPFLQRAVPGVPVLPIRRRSVHSGRGGRRHRGNGRRRRRVCSTDFSHYETDAAAAMQDERTARAVEALRPDLIGVRDACGVFALRGTVEWARRSGCVRPGGADHVG